MSSPYGPSGGNDPQQWGPQQPQQPYGPGQVPGTPSGGFPAQGGYPQQQQPGGYPQQDPNAGYPQQPDPNSGGFPAQGGYPQPGQQYPGYNQPQQQQPYGPPGYDQSAQQYGPGGYGPGQVPGQPKKKSGALIWVAVVVVVLIAAAVGVLGFVTPGWFNKKVLDNTAVQQGVVTILKDKYGETASDVSCPADQPVKAGTTFTCSLKVNGASRTVTITVKNEDKAEYEVSQSK